MNAMDGRMNDVSAPFSAAVRWFLTTSFRILTHWHSSSAGRVSAFTGQKMTRKEEFQQRIERERLKADMLLQGTYLFVFFGSTTDCAFCGNQCTIRNPQFSQTMCRWMSGR